MSNVSTDFARLAQQLNFARRGDFVQGLPATCDVLIDAAFASQWQQVQRLAELLARSAVAFGISKIATAAEDVAQAAVGANPELGVKRAIIQLILAAGQVDLRREFDSLRRAG